MLFVSSLKGKTWARTTQKMTWKPRAMMTQRKARMACAVLLLLLLHCRCR